MLEPVLDHKPRGFSGRPLLALVSAVGIGSLAAYTWVPPIIAGGVLGIVGYVWYQSRKPSRRRNDAPKRLNTLRTENNSDRFRTIAN